MKQRGFAGLLLAMAIVLLATMLLTTSNETRLNESYNETIPQTAVIISNYEIGLMQIAAHCGWSNTAAAIKTCLDTDSVKLFTAMQNQNGAKCTKISSSSIASPKSVTFDLNCNVKKGPNFNITLIKQVKLTDPST
jgi:hypothetical protein